MNTCSIHDTSQRPGSGFEGGGQNEPPDKFVNIMHDDLLKALALTNHLLHSAQSETKENVRIIFMAVMKLIILHLV